MSVQHPPQQTSSCQSTPNTPDCITAKGRGTELTYTLLTDSSGGGHYFQEAVLNPPTCSRALLHHLLPPLAIHLLLLIKGIFLTSSSRVMVNPSGRKCCLWQKSTVSDQVVSPPLHRHLPLLSPSITPPFLASSGPSYYLHLLLVLQKSLVLQ